MMLLHLVQASDGLLTSANSVIRPTHESDQISTVPHLVRLVRFHCIYIPFSVPQGPVAGPVLYSLYASTLSDVIPPGFKISGYADDHSFYSSFKPDCGVHQANCVSSMQDLLVQVLVASYLQDEM